MWCEGIFMEMIWEKAVGEGSHRTAHRWDERVMNKLLIGVCLFAWSGVWVRWGSCRNHKMFSKEHIYGNDMRKSRRRGIPWLLGHRTAHRWDEGVMNKPLIGVCLFACSGVWDWWNHKVFPKGAYLGKWYEKSRRRGIQWLLGHCTAHRWDRGVMNKSQPW